MTGDKREITTMKTKRLKGKQKKKKCPSFELSSHPLDRKWGKTELKRTKKLVEKKDSIQHKQKLNPSFTQDFFFFLPRFSHSHLSLHFQPSFLITFSFPFPYQAPDSPFLSLSFPPPSSSPFTSHLSSSPTLSSLPSPPHLTSPHTSRHLSLP